MSEIDKFKALINSDEVSALRSMKKLYKFHLLLEDARVIGRDFSRMIFRFLGKGSLMRFHALDPNESFYKKYGDVFHTGDNFITIIDEDSYGDFLWRVDNSSTDEKDAIVGSYVDAGAFFIIDEYKKIFIYFNRAKEFSIILTNDEFTEAKEKFLLDRITIKSLVDNGFMHQDALLL